MILGKILSHKSKLELKPACNIFLFNFGIIDKTNTAKFDLLNLLQFIKGLEQIDWFEMHTPLPV